MVVKAIVERPDYSFLPAELLDERGRLSIDEATKALGDGVFAGGDFVTGPATVAQATCAGRDGSRVDRPLSARRDGRRGAEARGGAGLQHRRRLQGLVPAAEQPGRRAREVARGAALRVSTSRRPAPWSRPSVAEEAGRCFNCGCVAVNSSDIAPALVALGAEIRTSKRAIDAEDFFAVARRHQHGARRRRDGARGRRAQGGAGHPLGLHQVRAAQVDRLPGGQLRGRGRPSRPAW